MKKNVENSGDAPAKKGGGRGKPHVCGSEEHFAHTHCGLCRSLEHRAHDYEEPGAEKGAMLAKIIVPANAKVGPIAATTGEARGDGKEVWDSDFGASFCMSHVQTGMTALTRRRLRGRPLRSLIGPFAGRRVRHS